MRINFPRDLLKYATLTRKSNNLQIIVLQNIIRDDMFMKAGKNKILGENWSFIYGLLSGKMTEGKFVSLIQRSFGVESNNG